MNTEHHLQQDEFWQTQQRGTHCQEYEIYKACAESLGWKVKTYEEWLNS